MMRFFDIILSGIGLVFLSPLFLIIFIIGLFDTGSPLFRQERIGQSGMIFTMVKFRTMRIGTASVASHLADSSAITSFGCFLRKSKLDELPQLWNVLKGDMSLVGPRPGLLNQIELATTRERLGIFEVRPGITGLSQVSGIDMSNTELLAQTDARMIAAMSISNYFKYIFLTLLGNGSGDRINS